MTNRVSAVLTFTGERQNCFDGIEQFISIGGIDLVGDVYEKQYFGSNVRHEKFQITVSYFAVGASKHDIMRHRDKVASDHDVTVNAQIHKHLPA